MPSDPIYNNMPVGTPAGSGAAVSPNVNSLNAGIAAGWMGALTRKESWIGSMLAQRANSGADWAKQALTRLGNIKRPSVGYAVSLDVLNQMLMAKDLPDDEYKSIAFRGVSFGDNNLANQYAKRPLYGDLSDRITDIDMSLADDQISQMTIQLEDPGFKLYNQQIFETGGELTYHGVPWIINQQVAGPGASGLGGVTVTARPFIVQALKNQRGAFTANNVSPSDYAILECNMLSGLIVAQPDSTKRTSIARQQWVEGQNYSEEEYPSAWTTLEQLADDKGYMLFECLGVLFFCAPSWLYQQAAEYNKTSYTTVGVYWNNSKSALGTKDQSAEEANSIFGGNKSQYKQIDGIRWEQTISAPGITTAQDQAPGTFWTVEVEVPTKSAGHYYVGQRLVVRGMGSFNESTGLLISAIDYSLVNTGTCKITAKSPYDPKPGTDTSTNNAGSLSGTKYGNTVLSPGTYGGTKFDHTQLINASIIFQTATGIKGATARDAIIALTTAITESTLHDYTNPSVPTSSQYPNDGPPPSGGDHDSVGLFQQRASWGSVQARMDPATSTKLFMDRLPSLFIRNALPIGSVCQKVQVSRYPDRYQKNVPAATALVNKMIVLAAVNAATGSGTPGATAWTPGHPLTTKTNTDFVNIALKEVGKTYTVGPPIVLNGVPSSFDCSSLVQWAAHQVGINYPRDTWHQLPWCQSHGTMITVEEALHTRGAVFFKPDNSHTGISMGDGKHTIEAYDVGYGVIINGPDKYGYHWGYGAKIPGMRYQ